MKIASLVIILTFLPSGCQENMTIQKEVAEELMNTSRAWTNSKTTSETLSFWADDALVLAPGQPTIKGKESIRKMVEASKQIPGFKVKWEPKEVHISESGDMAYMIEHNYFEMNDSLGNPKKSFNKVVTIWKKQNDGAWKNVVDIWNADPTITAIE